MTVLSAQTIRRLALISPLREAFHDPTGNSGGLGPCGYDLTVDQDVLVEPQGHVLASSVERFDLPADVMCVVHDKSSLARRGLAVQNTIAEPGWRGWLTLEFTNHSSSPIVLPRGAAVAQAIFHRLDEATELPYAGKYQDQGDGPQGAR